MVSSVGKFGVKWRNLILALVGTKYRFYHRGKLTNSTKICQFRWFRSKPELFLITGLFSFLTPINLVSAINQVINQVLNLIFNLETQDFLVLFDLRVTLNKINQSEHGIFGFESHFTCSVLPPFGSTGFLPLIYLLDIFPQYQSYGETK